MTDNAAMVSDAQEEVVEIEVREEKKGKKWTYEKAISFLTKNGHKVGEKQVHLNINAGIASFGCADYLRNYHKFEVFYAGKE